MKLNEANLNALPAGINVPNYDRKALTPGIVHIGTGNFHRAHMAVYLDDLFGMGLDHDWAILGAGVREGDEKMRRLLETQDYLSSVTERAPDSTSTRIIGAMPGFVPVDPTNAPLIAAMSDAAIRIVSLTVTEGGYFIDPKTGTFSPEHPAIQRDAANPDAPETVFGAIIAALKARRAAGLQPFTVMSCDNVPHNGHVTRDAVIGLARLSDAELAEWIGTSVAFPSSMVDRITPATGPHEIQMIAGLGLEDAAPVTCEPFRQWVIEDNFPAGRPQLEKVGVTFTEAVDAYETMKIRILNGGHAILAYPAGLRDIHFVHEAMQDDQIRAFLDKVEQTEILPIVPPVPDTDLSAYKQLILERCANSAVADTIRRLCLDGSNRQPKFIVPSIRDVVAKGGDATGLILLSALWCRYCFGTSETGAEIAPNDPSWEQLTLVAARAKDDPSVWLAMREVYGDLGENAAVVARFDQLLRAVWADGSQAVIARYLDGTL
ncbi:mannitol dehydrogenase family protein [Falsirhodobacter algicola]|uniref:Mannitol dehydrogenase family protein n=1 Tax=Falsirhodobacter algicola TaxID=2692330 RepID=A0A8J8SKC8_9RHOB|nr:mannitol dehydrogenase family protein [Falsirhodobacter algicola]QUS35232.1 mannitol dehydrogenase family protein [Falsirhodobacter algicola]